MMSRFFPLLLTAAGLGLAAPAAAGPDAALTEFYQRYQSMKMFGLPDARQTGKLAPWLSSGLQTLIAKARQEQARCRKAFQDEKPPWVDDNLFTSNSEGFTTFRVNGSNAARLTVQFEYVENSHRFSWKDDVEMVREGGAWKVNDIFFRQSAKRSESLRGGLAGPGCSR